MKLCRSLLFIAGPVIAGPVLPVHAQASQAAAHPHSEAMSHESDARAVPSTVLAVQTPAQTLSLSIADLQAMPQTTLKVHNEHTKTDESYAGPLLSEVLAKAGVVVTGATQHDVLRMYLIAGGTDGYFVIYSAAEVEPGLHKADVIVAITQDGKPLTRTGAFQLIDAQDVKPARWVRNLNKLTLKLQAQ